MNEQNKYSGLVVCADCGSTMVLHRAHTMKPTWNNFTCRTYKKEGAEVCTTHYIRECVLDEVVLEDLRRVTAMAREHTREFAEYIGGRQSAEIQREIRRLERELTALRKRDSELDAIFKRLYEDRVPRFSRKRMPWSHRTIFFQRRGKPQIFQGDIDSLLVVGGRHEVRRRLDLLRRVAHGDPKSRAAQHFQVHEVVPTGHGRLPAQTVVGLQRLHGGALGNASWQNLQIGRAGAQQFQLREHGRRLFLQPADLGRRSHAQQLVHMVHGLGSRLQVPGQGPALDNVRLPLNDGVFGVVHQPDII